MIKASATALAAAPGVCEPDKINRQYA